MAAKKEEKRDLSVYDIKDLMSLYDATKIVINYYNNLAESAKGDDNIYSKTEFTHFNKLSQQYGNILNDMVLEMEKRINKL